MINCRLNLFRSSASFYSSQYLFCFSNHQGVVFFLFFFFFFFFFLFLFSSIQPSVLQLYLKEGNLYLEYVQSNWSSYAGYCLEASSCLLYVQELNYLLCLAILSSPFSSNTMFRNCQTTSAPIFLVSSSLSHKMQYFKRNT